MAINSRLTLDNTQFRAALQQSSGAIGTLVADASTSFQGLYAQTDALNSRLSRGIGRFASDLKSIGKNLSLGVSLPLLGLAGASIEAYGQIDSLKRGLFSIEKTAENTEARFNSLKEVAALPGLGLEEAVKGDIRLRAVGISADLSKKSLLEFGNAIALTGGGKADLDRVTTQLAQMSAKSKVLAQDLKPIIEAAPSVSQALQKMFGTVDSEEISKSLKAKGLNSTDFIGILVKEMEKLPRVSGGIKNAMENMGDSLKVAGYEFGQILDKTLGLSDKLNGLGEYVGKAVQYFKELSPETQKLIITLGGIAIAAGPVLIAIGYLTSSTTMLAVGFGNVAKAAQMASAFVIANPYVIAALAVVALGTYLYSTAKATDALSLSQKSYNEVNAQAQASVVTETAKVNALIAITRSEVRTKEEKLGALNKLIAISPTYFGKLNLETVQTGKAEAATKKYTDALMENAIAKGAEAKVTQLGTKLIDELQAFDDATKEYKSTVKSLRDQGVPVDEKFAKSGGNGFLQRLASEAENAKAKIEETKNAIKSLQQYIKDPIVTKEEKNTGFKGGGGGGETKNVKDEFGINSAKLIQEALRIHTELYKKAIDGNLSAEINFLNQQYELQKQAIQNEVASEAAKHIALLTAEEKFQADLQAIRNKYKTPDLLKSKGANMGGIGSTFNDGTSAFGKLQSVGSPVNPLAESLKSTIPTLDGYYAKMTDTTRENMLNLNGALSAGLSNATASALAGLGGLLGAMAVGNASIGDVGNMLLSTMGNMFGQMGEQMITTGVGLLALKLAIKNPFALIAAGLALTALKGALSSTISKTTSGGGGGGSYGGGGGSGFSNPYQGGMNNFKPIEVLIKGDSVMRGSDIYTTYTNQKTYTDRIRRR